MGFIGFTALTGRRGRRACGVWGFGFEGLGLPVQGSGFEKSYLWLVGNGGMGYNYNYYYYHSSIPY